VGVLAAREERLFAPAECPCMGLLAGGCPANNPQQREKKKQRIERDVSTQAGARPGNPYLGKNKTQ
jgi:hypothetical protein